MELKDTKNLSTTVEKGVTPVIEGNNSNNRKVYEILFPYKEDEANPNISNKNAHQSKETIIFGSVSTLDWLKTWRSLEEN